MNPTACPADDLAALQSTLLTRFHEIEHGQSKLFACFPAPEECFPDQLWKMNLAAGWFEGLDQGEVSFAGTVEPIGFFHHADSTWEWAWGIPLAEALRKWVMDRPELAQIANLAAFPCTDELANLLANWIAVGRGAIAAYPADHEGRTLYVAVKTPGRDPSSWCSLCGADSQDGYSLIPGRYGVVCTDCLDTMTEMSGGYREGATGIDDDVSCILCGSTGTFHVHCNHSAVCGDCLDTHRALLPERDDDEEPL